jgi:endonuclease/exonuclease/phosphatase family metal-dependent hydrolase
MTVEAESPAAEPPLIGATASPGLHVMSWNIRRRSPRPRWSADDWHAREKRLTALLRAERPSVLGMQEAMPGQARAVKDALGPDYRLIGRGRASDGRGEGCPICFDARRLELIDASQRALSARPDTDGSRSWGNIFPRIRVAATFGDRTNGSRILVVNTHFDHLSHRSRVRSAGAVHELISTAPSPVVVMGDLNADERSTTLLTLRAGDALGDAWTLARSRVTPRWGTFSGYRTPQVDGRRIDWILVSPSMPVTVAAINHRRYAGGWGSDHLPVQAVVRPPSDGRTA